MNDHTSSKHNPPTMQDVARLVGVSVQTVSAVLNGKPGITPETAARVRAAVQQLGYRPYSVARSLRTRQTHTIALVVPDIANPSFAAIASAAEDYAHAHGYNLTLYNTHDDVARETAYIQMAVQRWVDGMLFVSAADEMTALESLVTAGIPAVAIDRIPAGYAGPAVTLDHYAAGRMAAEYLLSLGHTCLCHISGPLRLSLSRQRMMGFCEAVTGHGLGMPACRSQEGIWTCESGYQAMRAILAAGEKPTALFAANDRMAIGAMLALRQAELRVPRDFSVIGLDDIEVSAYQDPQLTSVRQSFAAMAVAAVQLLLELFGGKTPEAMQVVLAPELVVRESTAGEPLATNGKE